MPMKTQADYDLVVIGGGPAGEKGAARAAYFGKKVALVEMAPGLGGAAASATIPSKTLRETALIISGLRQRGLYGVDLSYKEELDVGTFLFRERHVRAAVQTTVADNMARHQVDHLTGQVTFLDPHTLCVSSANGKTIIGAAVILIATGSRPVRPALFPFAHPQVYDADTIFNMSNLPRTITIVGGGVVGCEFACLFAALGIAVDLVHPGDGLFPFIDHEITANLAHSMQAMGINLHPGEKVTAVVPQVPPGRGDKALGIGLASGREINTEALLVAVGRASNTEHLALEKAGITVGARGLIPVNQWYQTAVPHIYAAGDVIGFPALASTAMEQARIAVGHAFNLTNQRELPNLTPYGIWTIPEISTVGATEQKLQEEQIPYVVGRARYTDNPRGLILGEKHGLLKLLFSATDGKLLGVHIIGQEACELISTGLTALVAGMNAYHLVNLCFNYPSLSDLYKYAAYDALDKLERPPTE